MASPTGAQIIARSLHELGVTVLFGIVGIPVVEIAEEAINLGIKFIGFRNEQAASYAASAYGYLTGKPGVCLVVGGPGVLHAMAGIGNSHINAFPLLLLAGSSETHLTTKGAFQELDAISLLTPHTKLSLRPPTLDSIPHSLQTAYRTSFYGRPGTSFIDLPADLVQGTLSSSPLPPISTIPHPPRGGADPAKIQQLAHLLRTAKSPLLVIGKGAAYSRASSPLLPLLNLTNLPFLPTPMGKGTIPDSHPSNTSSARSTALAQADLVLLLGARLNWILHFGAPPKWSPTTRFVQIDLCAEEIGRNASPADAALGLVGDVATIVTQLLPLLEGWKYPADSQYLSAIRTAAQKNESKAKEKAEKRSLPLTYARTFHLIRETLHELSPVDDGGVVYVSEGANTMDISRSMFPVSKPRLRLDAGTHATMGVGLGYAIAAWVAYNGETGEGYVGEDVGKRGKKVVALEGDSAFGFSAMEIETMSRYGMDVLVFVMNNGGVYHGEADSVDEWLALQRHTLQPASGGGGEGMGKGGLRSTSLGYEVAYEKFAEACGGVGFLVRSEEELVRATREGFKEKRVVVVNVVIEAGKGQKLEFGWQASARKGGKGESKL